MVSTCASIKERAYVGQFSDIHLMLRDVDIDFRVFCVMNISATEVDWMKLVLVNIIMVIQDGVRCSPFVVYATKYRVPPTLLKPETVKCQDGCLQGYCAVWSGRS